jgi:hypothetical protein
LSERKQLTENNKDCSEKRWNNLLSGFKKRDYFLESSSETLRNPFSAFSMGKDVFGQWRCFYYQFMLIEK